MDQVTKVKKHLKRERWKNLIKDCQSSRMTVSAWCKMNDICEQTYYRNLRKLREELCETLPVALDAVQKPVAFKRLEVATPLQDTRAAVIIRLPQATLEINESTRQQTVQAVLLALQSVCKAISLLLNIFTLLAVILICANSLTGLLQ